MGKQPSGPPGSTTRSSRPTLIIRKTITLPDGSTVDLMIRGDDLPDDVRAYLEAERAKFIESLRAKMPKTPTTAPTEGMAPTTQPASHTLAKTEMDLSH